MVCPFIKGVAYRAEKNTRQNQKNKSSEIQCLKIHILNLSDIATEAFVALKRGQTNIDFSYPYIKKLKNQLCILPPICIILSKTTKKEML